MPRHTHTKLLKPFVAAVLALAFLPWVAVQPIAAAQSPEPTLTVQLDHDTISGNGWEPNSTVAITFDDDANHGNGIIDYIEGTADGDGSFNINGYDPAGVDRVPGYDVTADDGTITKTLIIAEIRDITFDVDNDLVSGFATPESSVTVVIHDSPYNRGATTGVNGAWTADFSPGDADDYDLRPGDGGVVFDNSDDDGDITALNWRIPNPTFSVDPNENTLWGNDFMPSSTVDVTTGSETVPGSPFPTDERGDFSTSFDPAELDLVTGVALVASDTTSTKDHAVTELVVLTVDPVENVIAGTAASLSEVRVDVHSGPWEASRTVAADEFGDWSTDFDDAGDGGSTYDFGPGDNGAAEQCDADNDCTQIHWNVRNASFQVDVASGSFWANEFEPGGSLTIDVDGTGYGPFGLDQWGNFDGNSIGLTLPVAAGQSVTVADGSRTKDHTVTELVVLTVDPVENVIAGTAASLSEVRVDVHSGPWEASRTVAADAFGDWSTDFDTPGDGGQVYDFGPGDNGAAEQCDADNDCTQIHWNVRNASFQVDVASGSFWANEFEPNGSIMITIDADGDVVEHGPYGLDAWGNFDSNNNGLSFDVSAGLLVTVSDGTTAKDHTVAALTVTVVDVDTNVVAGTADPDSELYVSLHSGQWASGRTVTADEFGNWSTDFDDAGDDGATADLGPDDNGSASQCDVDGDCTNVNWSVANPTITASVSHEEIWADGWPDDPDGQLLYWRLDDPSTPDVDHEGDMPLLVTPWGTEAGDRSFGTYDVQAGQLLTVRNRPFGDPLDGGLERVLDVSSLVVTAVDADNDLISGIADPLEGGYLCVYSSDAELCSDEDGFTWNADNTFVADFGSVGSNVKPGHWNEASQYDDDGDRTHFWWNLPPWVVVNLAPEDQGTPRWPDEVRAESWVGPIVTLTINGSWVADIEVTGNEHDQTTIELPGLDIEPGDVVTLDDGTDTKTVVVETLGIDHVNFSTDDPPNTIQGSGTPDRDVRVEVTSSVGGRWAERWVRPDSGGTFVADFGEPGNGWREQWTAELGGPQGLGRNVRLEVYDDDNDRTESRHCEGVPRIEVSRFDNRVTVYDYPQGTSVTIEIDDPNTPESPDYIATGVATPNPENPCETIIVFDIVDYEIPEQGTVVATDGTPEGTVTHDPIPFTLDVVDPDTDQIHGTTVPGIEVQVQANGPQGAIWRYVTAGPDRGDGLGDWLADFSVVPDDPEPGEDGTVDIAPGSNGRAIVLDLSGNSTELTWHVASANFQVDPTTEQLWVNEFEPDSLVTVTVDRGEGPFEVPGSPLGTDNGGNFGAGFDSNELDLQAGDLVEVSDGTTIKEHTITNLTVEVVPEADTISGTATAGSEVCVDLWGYGQHCVTATDGSWEVITSQSPFDHDLQPGDQGNATQYDDDNDATQIYWRIANASFQVIPAFGVISVNEFEADSSVTITIDGTDVGSYPTDGGGNFYSNNFGVAFDVEVGSEVSVTDGVNNKTHEVTELTVAGADPVADTVSGTAAIGAEVCVDVSGWGQDCTVATDGTWTIYTNTKMFNFADLQPGDQGLASEADDDGDSTAAFWRIVNARFSVNPTSEGVWGAEFTPGSDVTVTVNDAAAPGSPFETDGWGNFGTGFDPSELDLAAGDTVIVSDGDTTKTHLVTDLTVTGVDAATDSVTGTAEPGSEVCVGLPQRGESCVTATDGNWSISTNTADFDYADLQPGDQGYAAQRDDDGDDTVLDWRIANANFQVDPSTEQLWANEFQPDSQVWVTVDGTGVPGPPTISDPWGNVYFSFDPNQLDLQAGNVVVVSDGATGKDHTITHLVVTDVDPDSNVVAGTADPYTDVWVDIHGFWEAGRMVGANSIGEWDTDFDTPGEGGGTYDLVAGDEGGYASQCDGDNDCTQINWNVSNPTIVASLTSDWIFGEGFAPDTAIDITANGEFYDDLVMTEGDGSFWIGGVPVTEEERLDLVAGTEIVASDGATTKQLTLVDLTFPVFDLANDIVEGTAAVPEETEIGIDVGNESIGGWSAQTATDAVGTWSYDFSTEFDLVETMLGSAGVSDEEGDVTVVEFVAPFIEAFLATDRNPAGGIIIIEATPESLVSVDVYRDSSLAEQIYDFDVVAPPLPSDATELVLDAPEPMVPGRYIVATDHASGYVKTLEVLDLTYDTFDTEGDLAAGTGPPDLLGSVTFLDGGPEEVAEVSGAEVTTDDMGRWEVAEIDLLEEMRSMVAFVDTEEVGDATYKTIDPSTVIVDVADNSVVVEAPQSDTITVAIVAETGSVLGTFSGVLVDPAPSGDELPTAVLAYAAHGIDLAMGMTVRVTEDAVGRVKSIDVPGLSVDDVDAINDTAAGAGPPDSEMLVEVTSPTGERSSVVVVTDGNGTWFAELSEPAGIGPDDRVRAFARDREWPDLVGFFEFADIASARQVVAISEVSVPTDPVRFGEPADVLVSFTDDPWVVGHTATIDWDDGTSSRAAVDETAMTAWASHTYAAPGVYRVTVTLSDSSANSDVEVSDFVVVYDPDGGFVTGGGWIRADGATSDAGDSFPGIEGDDKINFGFNVKYKKNSTTPTGQVNVQLGDLHLHSDDVHWLVISGGSAVFRGAVTIDDQSHLFLVFVTDGAITGGDDRFEIRVAAPGGSPFFDEPLYQATGDLQGGSIKIHNK